MWPPAICPGVRHARHDRETDVTYTNSRAQRRLCGRHRCAILVLTAYRTRDGRVADQTLCAVERLAWSGLGLLCWAMADGPRVQWSGKWQSPGAIAATRCNVNVLRRAHCKTLTLPVRACAVALAGQSNATGLATAGTSAGLPGLSRPVPWPLHDAAYSKSSIVCSRECETCSSG